MCDLQKRFTLCTCAPEAGKPLPKGAMRWELRSYAGPATHSMEGLYNFPDFEIEATFSSEWVAAELNSRQCFDFDCVPSEQDELRIYEGGGRYRYLSFLYRQGQWVPNQFHGFEADTAHKDRGWVEFAVRMRQNSLRHYLHAEKQRWADVDHGKYLLAHYCLEEVERFTERELEAEPGMLELVGLMVDSAIAAAQQWKEVDADYARAVQARLQALALKPVVQPALPYRRVLTSVEYAAAWDRLQTQLLQQKPPEFLMDQDAARRWQEEMAAREVMLLHLDPMQLGASHRLSSFWVEEMLAHDDSYWMDDEMTWCLAGDGHGYWYTAGNWHW